MTEELSVVEWNDDNKLLALYRAGIDNPDQKSPDKKYTNAELALRIDLGKKRLVFTGNFWQDLKYMLWNNHAVLSLVRANYLDPFTRKGRFIVLTVTLAITAVSAVFISTYGYEDECTEGHGVRPGSTSEESCLAMSGCCYFDDDEHDDGCMGCKAFATPSSKSAICADDPTCFWPVVTMTSILVFFFNYLCRFLWVCQCAQGGNNKVRCLAEKTGSLIVAMIGFIAVITVSILVFELGLGNSIFVTFFAQTIMSWFQDIFISCLVFRYRAYPNEKRAVQEAFDEGKKKFNSSVQELEARGLEVKTDNDLSFCSNSVLTGLFFMRGDQDDYTVGAIKDDAQNAHIEMGGSTASGNVVKTI